MTSSQLESVMNTTTSGHSLATVAAATTVLRPVLCQAATGTLPWDQTLVALQDMLISYIAPTAIGLAFSGGIVLYALGGRDEQAGRLFGSALGGCIALAIVYLLNYVAF
jgi:hypothetical protein